MIKKLKLLSKPLKITLTIIMILILLFTMFASYFAGRIVFNEYADEVKYYDVASIHDREYPANANKKLSEDIIEFVTNICNENNINYFIHPNQQSIKVKRSDLKKIYFKVSYNNNGDEGWHTETPFPWWNKFEYRNAESRYHNERNGSK